VKDKNVPKMNVSNGSQYEVGLEPSLHYSNTWPKMLMRWSNINNW